MERTGSLVCIQRLNSATPKSQHLRWAQRPSIVNNQSHEITRRLVKLPSAALSLQLVNGLSALFTVPANH